MDRSIGHSSMCISTYHYTSSLLLSPDYLPPLILEGCVDFLLPLLDHSAKTQSHWPKQPEVGGELTYSISIRQYKKAKYFSPKDESDIVMACLIPPLKKQGGTALPIRNLIPHTLRHVTCMWTALYAVLFHLNYACSFAVSLVNISFTIVKVYFLGHP